MSRVAQSNRAPAAANPRTGDAGLTPVARLSSQSITDSRLTAGVPLKSQEHIDLMAQFEREHSRHPIAKEAKELWAKGRIYQNGQINELFLLYRRGYTLGKHVALAATAPEVA